MKKDELIVKICKKVIVVFGILTVFNFIMLISGKSYALFTKTITTNDPVIHIETATEFPGPTLVDELKSKLVKYEDASKSDFERGIIAINTNGELYNEKDSSQIIREYRYYYNDKIYPELSTNYVKFNDELWQILGVFKDEGGTEYVKIISNNLPTDIPDEYVVNGTTYKINAGDGKVYYNYITGDETDSNDWSKAGLQYYLNTIEDSKGTKGYLSHLSNKASLMLQDEKYYLGSVNANSGLPKDAYNKERDVLKCEGGVGPATNNSSEAIEANTGCRVWAGNQATWTGKVGLLYPSDYVLSGGLEYWNKDFNDWDGTDTPLYNDYWLNVPYFTISPGIYSKSSVICFESFRSFLYPRTSKVNNIDVVFLDHSLYIALALKKSIKVTKGDGSYDNPYELI